MGGSLRRHKNAKPLILKKKKKKSKTRMKTPSDILAGARGYEEKLGERPEWDPRSGFGSNYATLGLVSNVNQLEPREPVAQEPKEHEEDVDMDATEPQIDADEIQDDDLRAALSRPKKGGPGPPAKLTSIQRRCIGKLLEKYGEDTKRMQLDRKRNPMQHAESVLRKMIHSFRYWKPNAGVDFRAPQKVLWRTRHCG